MTFDDYLRSIAPLTAVAIQPDAVEEHAVIREAADALVALDASERSVLAELVRTHPRWVPILGLVVGLSQERLKNVLRHHFDTSGWINLARDRSEDLIGMLDEQYALVAKLEAQRKQTYGFADVLVARAGSRTSSWGGGSPWSRRRGSDRGCRQGFGAGMRSPNPIHWSKWRDGTMRPR
jgi:cobalamin biosynthesis Mg chelatase CobN